MKPLLLTINPEYFYNLLDWRGVSYELAGTLASIESQGPYNNLIKLNSLFSTKPVGDPIDRTGTVQGLLKFHVSRPWTKPTACLPFDEVMLQRVMQYVQTGKYLNICWSGGIDSTCMVISFLQHAPNIDQIRILHTPYSIYENRDFFEYLQKNHPGLEMIDISGDVYLESTFQGIVINGHGGDEFTSSLDRSFFEAHGVEKLHQPWSTLITDRTVQDFCEQFFSLSHRPIETVLEARWWFYAATKSHVFLPLDSILFNGTDTSAFYNCQEFEDHMYFNTDKIIPGKEYKTYKQFMKDYIYKFYRNSEHHNNADKMNSTQFILYRLKKVELLGQQWIAQLADKTLIRTPNLPFISKIEFEQTYGDSLDYLFNS